MVWFDAPALINHHTYLGHNYKNRVLLAYLLGRGNANVHVVRRRNLVGAQEAVPNIFGKAVTKTHSERSSEIDLIIDHMNTTATSKLSYTHLVPARGDEKGGSSASAFSQKILAERPDTLQQVATIDVATRRSHWIEILVGTSTSRRFAHTY